MELVFTYNRNNVVHFNTTLSHIKRVNVTNFPQKDSDKQLKQFINKGGRSNAKSDFFTILKKATKPLGAKPIDTKR